MSIRTELPARQGPRPRTGPAIPHQQLSQIAPVELQDELWRRMTTLEGVVTGPSGISFPDTRALHLRPAPNSPEIERFLIGSEFAHLHGPADGSLHLCLPHDVVAEVERQGWGELHPIARDGKRPATLLMLFGPRDTNELKIVWKLVQVSHHFARDSQLPSRRGMPS
ncbi:luciferase family protein [Micromonospora sp. KC213]|uniref:luciferase domain-containing protein n=1 Tax=Micromonospora sp. KC213 TaxID=2530378 RepID=UPI001048D9B8|nr:luciferase family protein [Micromonospora sp. KC213]TDC38622.1 phospholipase [Micromonospora sp. KC213]